jgi:hypothetical protein
MNILTAPTAPAAAAPHIPQQRRALEPVPAPAEVYPDLFDAGRNAGAADAWSRLACPESFESHQSDRTPAMTGSEVTAYQVGYRAGFAEADADYAARGGYAGVMAEFLAETSSWTVQ